jgi:exosortase F-associated protein
MISLGILWLLFKEGKFIKFSVLLYAFFGTILMISFFFVLVKFGSTNKMNLFYIRRFIIQPIFLILFVPAFYYQEKIK